MASCFLCRQVYHVQHFSHFFGDFGFLHERLRRKAKATFSATVQRIEQSRTLKEHAEFLADAQEFAFRSWGDVFAFNQDLAESVATGR